MITTPSDRETWAKIKGYNYWISRFGRVKNSKGHILSQKINNRGFVIVVLSKDNIQKSFTVQRLVAEAFVPNPDKLPNVQHLDGDRLNNKFTNLKWVKHYNGCN